MSLAKNPVPKNKRDENSEYALTCFAKGFYSRYIGHLQEDNLISTFTQKGVKGKNRATIIPETESSRIGDFFCRCGG